MMRLSIRSFVILSLLALGGFLSLQACTSPQTAAPKEHFFCATHKDCPQPAVCIRSLCYPFSSDHVTCTKDHDDEPICVPNPNESLVLSDAGTTPPEDDDLDSTQIAEKKPNSSRLSEESTHGRERGSEPTFEPNDEHALPDVSEDTNGGLERVHVEHVPEPAPEPQPPPDSPRDPNLPCTQGQTAPCYPPDQSGCSLHSLRCLGRCKLGQMICEKGTWGACTGAITPQTERCDDQDWDCDGSVGNNGGRVCN